MIAQNEDTEFIVFGIVNRFIYTNHKGDTSLRNVIPCCLRFGTSPYHLDPQWLLEGFDINKNSYRTFALNEIKIDITHTNSSENSKVSTRDVI